MSLASRSKSSSGVRTIWVRPSAFGVVFLRALFSLNYNEFRRSNEDHRVQQDDAMSTRLPIRLMLFTDSFIAGGTERQFVETLRLLDRTRYDIRVGCLKRRGPFLADVEAAGVPVLEFPIRSLHGVDTVQWFARLVRYLRAERIDVVHAFEFYTSLFAVLAARVARVPVALASRRDLLSLRSPARQWAIRLGGLAAHGIVANSTAAVQRLYLGLNRKVTVIPNILDKSTFCTTRTPHEVRSELGLSADAPVFGAVSALRPEKGLETLLEAAAHVFRSLPEARLVIAGDGSEQARLKSLASQLNIAERVIFAGHRSDVPDVLSALDVVVSPSDTESLPNAVLEAMALARPVVATRVGGTPELVVDGETGYLVDSGASQPMAERIMELLRDSNVRSSMGDAGRERVTERYSPEHVRRALDTLYRGHLVRARPTARVLQISNYPPPMDGWAIHVVNMQRALADQDVDSRVLDIGPSRRVRGRNCVSVQNGVDYVAKLTFYGARGFLFQPHVNGDSWKGYVLATLAAIVGRLSGKPAVLMFHAGPSQLYFPRQRGPWRHLFRFLFVTSGDIICNFEPVAKAIAGYGISPSEIHPIFSVQYKNEEIPVPLAPEIESFLRAHEPRLFSYTLFRPEFTNEALFEAFAAIRRKYPHAGLLIAGPVDIPDDVAALLRQHGFEDAILITGNRPHPEFLTAVQRSDVFVRTHLRDGLCASVLEALSLGVPVVASEDGMRPASVVNFAPGDAEDLDRKLDEVLSDVDAARARVIRPRLDRGMQEEIDLLLASARRRG